MTTNIQVICRFRPPYPGQDLSNIQICEDKSVVIDQIPPFNFDRVFRPGTQEEVYESAAKPIIEAVLEGFNGTVVAYGQTGSGKTHTMEGGFGEDAGILKRMVNTLFEQIDHSPDNLEFRIKISVVEIYMEKIRDLQDIKKSDMKIREDKQNGIYVQGITETQIADQSEIYDILKNCNSNRQIASTNMNEQSSRSHMIFLMTVTATDINDKSAKTGKLFLVDLAGSEKVSKTGAEGKVLEEAKGINKSLSALGQVINALTDGSQHVPYRDSKLTRILQNSFGGNSRTTLIITCSPAQMNLQETISTLRFGIRAKAIKNKPKINKEHTVEELKLMVSEKEKEILLLQQLLSEYKKGLVISEEEKYILKEIEEDCTQPSLKVNQEQFNMLQEVNLKQEQDIEKLKQLNFQLKQEYDEIVILIRQKDEDYFQQLSDYKEQLNYHQRESEKKLSLISQLFSQKIGQISEKDLCDQELVGTHLDNFVKDKLQSKLKQINYLYKKHHKDALNEQMLAFLSDVKADFNIQNDQLNELNNQVSQLKRQNTELININDYQKNLLDTLEKTKSLLEAEQKRNAKLEKAIAQEKKLQDEKLDVLNESINQMMQQVYNVITEKQKYFKESNRLKKQVMEKDNKIQILYQEIQRLSIENQKLFIKYDSLKEMYTNSTQEHLNTSMSDSSQINPKAMKKVHKIIKGGGKTHNKSQSQIIVEKENEEKIQYYI